MEPNRFHLEVFVSIFVQIWFLEEGWRVSTLFAASFFELSDELQHKSTG